MSVNDYGNEIEKWKVELIFERARKLGFRRDELEDVQQELIFGRDRVRIRPVTI